MGFITDVKSVESRLIKCVAVYNTSSELGAQEFPRKGEGICEVKLGEEKTPSFSLMAL